MARTASSYTVGFYTLGCKVSQYESEAMAEAFERAGFLLRSPDTPCDVYVINTCTVTAESDRKCRQVIRRLYGQNPEARIMVCGCYAQTSPAEVAAIEGVCYVSGTGGKMALAARALDLLAVPPASPVCEVGDLHGATFEPMSVTRGPRTRVYVKIQDGCSGKCAYCAIAGARGPVRSKAPEDVMAEVAYLAGTGVREIVLTGIETAAYGTRDYGLLDLLEALDRCPDTPRLRLGSMSPEFFRPEVIERLGRLHALTPHLHISMQSGADKVLRGMRRRYLSGQVLDALEALRRAIPDVQFTTDLMVGFPGEGEAEFEQTLDFCRRARFLDAHVFAYSPRKNTPAATFEGQVPETVKRARSARLIAEKNEIRTSVLAALVERGAPLSVLFEVQEGGLSVGHAANFAEVSVEAEADLHGEIRAVLPIAVQDGRLIGRLL